MCLRFQSGLKNQKACRPANFASGSLYIKQVRSNALGKPSGFERLKSKQRN